MGTQLFFNPLDRRLEDRTSIGTVHCCSAVQRQSAEDHLLSQFKKAAKHFRDASIVQDGSRLEWLALMQHYGAPTRFLDFTRSPYVACFFALEEIQKDEKGQTQNSAIWAIDTEWLLTHSVRRIAADKEVAILGKDSFLDSDYVAANFDKLFVTNHIFLVLPIVPPRSNPRLLAQQGLFLCPSVAEAGFEKNLGSYDDDTQDMADHIIKIIVEGRIRTELLSEFRLMNISSATLFPDLQGYARSLAHEMEYRASDEIERLR